MVGEDGDELRREAKGGRVRGDRNGERREVCVVGVGGRRGSLEKEDGYWSLAGRLHAGHSMWILAKPNPVMALF